MELIPVVDLYQGQAVMAIRGRRESYRPLKTPLCQSSDPLCVVSALMQLGRFRVLYLADLDALLQTGDNGIIIHRIAQTFPDLHLWIDRGWPPLEPDINLTPVIGSESLGPDWKRALLSLPQPWILSLDFDEHGFLGPKDLLQEPDFWPSSVILMTLAKVGSQEGPDWQRLTAFQRKYPNIDWIAAGGVSGTEDLIRLCQLGIHRVLLASALHYGLIDLKSFAK